MFFIGFFKTLFSWDFLKGFLGVFFSWNFFMGFFFKEFSLRRHFWWFENTVVYSSSGMMKIWSLIFASVGALIRWLQELRRLMLKTFAPWVPNFLCAKEERKQLNLIFRLTTLETSVATHASNTAVVKSHQILCTKLIHLHVWAGDEQITL